jgi:two-component system LytT family response regulator
MIGGVIIDDEAKSREVLKFLLKEIGGGVTIIGEANSVESGLELICAEQPSVVFLDVEMLDGTGFNLLEQLPEINFKLIFTTAYDSYAIRAFKYSALDYLLKPIDTEELDFAVNKAIVAIEAEISHKYQIKALLDNIGADKYGKQLAISGAHKIDIVNESDIVCMMASGNYTEVYVLDEPVILSSKPLKHFSSVFDNNSNFFRISKSCLVNLHFVKTYKKDLNKVELSNGIEHELSRRRKKEFLTGLQLI